MHYEFNQAMQNVVFSDDSLCVGGENYPYSGIGNISITYNATFMTRGVVSFLVNGKTLNFPFVKKEADEMHRAVADLQARLSQMRAGAVKELRTATEMYKYCTDNGFGAGLTKNWGQKHFGIIERALLPDETVKMAFIGLHNYISASKHDGNYAYAVTDKRIICGQQKLIGDVLVVIKWENINDITMETHPLMGVLQIDTYKETFNVGLDRTSVKMIYDELRQVLNSLQSPAPVPGAGPAPAPAAAPASAGDPYEAVKKLKELLDLGALSQAEFDQKKKELLGL